MFPHKGQLVLARDQVAWLFGRVDKAGKCDSTESFPRPVDCMPHAGHSRPQQCSAIVRRTRDALANPDAEGGLAHANVHCRQQRILLSVVKSRTAQERGGGLVPDRRPSSSFRPASRPAPAVGVELHLAQTSASRLQRCRGGKKPRNRRSKAQVPACREPQGHRDEVAVQGFGKKSSEDAAPTAPAVRGSAEPRRLPPTTACRRAVRASRPHEHTLGPSPL